MPDAHVGYGLPIGGVLATDNAVIAAPANCAVTAPRFEVCASAHGVPYAGGGSPFTNLRDSPPPPRPAA